MSELKKLQKFFGKDHVIQHDEEHDVNDYTWYRNANGEEFGIRKTILNEDTRKLLEVFLTPLSARPMKEDQEQHAWYELLFKDRTSEHFSVQEGRLLHFQINSQDVEHELYVEAFKNMLSPHIIPVWKDRYSGVFVEPADYDYVSKNQLDELIHTIESDFYMKSSVFIGSTFTSIPQAKKQFDKESAYYKISSENPSKSRIHTIASALPSLLLHQANHEDLLYIHERIMKDVHPELVRTIKTFLESDLNYTVAAKSLFIHRNSLQYRIEKFTDLTGLDPKTFSDAVTCHLLISNNE